MKYYFITYRALNSDTHNESIWNECTDLSPPEFLKSFQEKYWYEYRVLNTCEITKEEFEKYKEEFG